MTITDPRGGVELTLSARGAGFAAIQQCLELQSEVAPLGTVERFFGANPLAQNARCWYLGALGEIVVAERLEQLGEDWRVVNGVPVGAAGSDIDHVVVGPTGVFTISLKAHAGKRVWAAGQALRINGFKPNFVRSAQKDAERASKLLTTAVGREIVVTPIVVMVGISELNYGFTRPEIDIVTSSGLVRNLKRRRPVLSVDEVTEIADVAGRRGTWHRDAVVVDDAQRFVERFEGLRRDVDAAARRRKTWSRAAKVVAIAAGLWIGMALVNVLVTELATATMR